VRAVALDLQALGDTEQLWADWLADAGRRARVDVSALDEQLPNWRRLLYRFAEERAPVYFRPDPQANAALRRLRDADVRIGVFTDTPEELARVALSQLGAARQIDELVTGESALEQLVARLGPETEVVRTRAQLTGLR
jgi:hypothetical protein